MTKLEVSHAYSGKAWDIEEENCGDHIATVFYNYKEYRELARKRAHIFAKSEDLLSLLTRLVEWNDADADRPQDDANYAGLDRIVSDARTLIKELSNV